MSCEKMAEPIEMPFGLWTWVGRSMCYTGGTLVPLGMCGGNAALCQITLTTCYVLGLPSVKQQTRSTQPSAVLCHLWLAVVELLKKKYGNAQ